MMRIPKGKPEKKVERKAVKMRKGEDKRGRRKKVEVKVEKKIKVECKREKMKKVEDKRGRKMKVEGKMETKIKVEYQPEKMKNVEDKPQKMKKVGDKRGRKMKVEVKVEKKIKVEYKPERIKKGEDKTGRKKKEGKAGRKKKVDDEVARMKKEVGKVGRKKKVEDKVAKMNKVVGKVGRKRKEAPRQPEPEPSSSLMPVRKKAGYLQPQAVKRTRVGAEYQAFIPELKPSWLRMRELDKALPHWTPLESLSDTDLKTYIDTAKSMGLDSEEQALGVLNWHRGDVHLAYQDAPKFTPAPANGNWLAEDRDSFGTAFKFWGKDFGEFPCLLSSRKPMTEIVAFYYQWKLDKRPYVKYMAKRPMFGKGDAARKYSLNQYRFRYVPRTFTEDDAVTKQLEPTPKKST